MPCCCCKCCRNDGDVEDEENASSINPNYTPAIRKAPRRRRSVGDVAVAESFNRDDEFYDDGKGDESSASASNSAARWNIAVFEDDDPDFNQLLTEAEQAIENGILPQRIAQGSSGSYFVKNSKEENIGVFKPKDEEPYGRKNPKWAKFFQRLCCPCCFGRGCLVPNSGYLSEAGASLVDYKLGLNVVPKTKVIRMASTTFHYGRIRRGAASAKKTLADKFPTVGKRFHRIGLPLKIGSFQMFVKGYRDAILWIQEFEAEPLPPDVASEFQLEFEKLVILDYIIRNTDRGNENWLIRYDKEGTGDDEGISLVPFSCGKTIKKDEETKPKIKIAAIDNGLAFPFKHPNEWRAYPFQWSKLPYARNPFSAETREKFLPVLSNIDLIEEICTDLYFIFSLDKRFKMHVFEKQMSVLRGQILNLANALRDGKSPFDIVNMSPVKIIRSVDVPNREQSRLNGASTMVQQPVNRGPRTLKISPTNTLMFDGDEYKPEFAHETPVFRSW